MRQQGVEIKVGQQRLQEVGVVRLAEYTLYYTNIDHLYCRLVFLAVYPLVLCDRDGKRYHIVPR